MQCIENLAAKPKIPNIASEGSAGQHAARALGQKCDIVLAKPYTRKSTMCLELMRKAEPPAEPRFPHGNI